MESRRFLFSFPQPSTSCSFLSKLIRKAKRGAEEGNTMSILRKSLKQNNYLHGQEYQKPLIPSSLTPSSCSLLIFPTFTEQVVIVQSSGLD